MSGAGRALLAAVEAWAIERGYRLLSLNVFDRNVRARALYEKNGFEVDTLRYVKELRRSGDP
jgi:GNAT superfamily N-acetyltransferase